MKIDQVDEKWTKKYKKSIDCSNPKGFSQKAHCAGKKKRKKNESVQEPRRESLVLEDGWWDAYEKIRDAGDDIVPYLKKYGVNPYSKSDVMAFIDTNLGNNQGIVKMAMDAPAWMISSMAANAGIDANELKKMIAVRNQYKKDNPGFADQFRADPVATWQNIKSEARLQELKIEKPNSVDTKGLKRSQMPQIHKDDYNEFIDYLKDNGAEFTKQTMPAKQLKATQGEFSDKGVMKQIGKQMRGEPRKPVIASQDNFIIDGHHRWLVAWNTKDSVDVFKVNMDADKLLELVKKFPKTTYKDIYTEELYDFDKDKPMQSTVAIPGYGTMSIDGLMKNLVQSVTELLGRMKQGTDGMRFADYELNSNKVLTTKLGALIKALDDLQAIRKQGGARSRNITKEQEQEQLPIDTDRVFSYIQKLESGQNISPQDADLMRRGIQSLESARQTLNPQAILQLLTILT